jgi:Helix-turn-helix domain
MRLDPGFFLSCMLEECPMPTLYSRELPSMLRVSDVASYLDVSPRVAYRLVKQPGFPLVVLNNKCWRIPRDAFFAWLEAEPGTKNLIEARAARETHGE